MPVSQNGTIYIGLCTVRYILVFYQLQVNSEYDSGRLAEALKASETAKIVNYVGLGIGTALIVLYIVIIVISSAVAAASA